MLPANLPYEFVNEMINPGIQCDAGYVKLNQYLCKTIGNGGNDNAAALIGPLRFMKEGGKGATMNKIVGGTEVDLCLKGQGDPASFGMMWDFMCRNKEQLKTLKVKVGHRPKEDRQNLAVDKTGNIYDLYFKDRSDAAALQKMVEDRFFGIDCIGFTSNYLIYVGEWDKYYGYNAGEWDRVFKKSIRKASEIQPLDLLLWGGHVALIDWVWGMADQKTMRVDVCQSSSGGPQCNEFVYLEETTLTNGSGYQLFKIAHRGTLPMPVYANACVMRREGFYKP